MLRSGTTTSTLLLLVALVAIACSDPPSDGRACEAQPWSEPQQEPPYERVVLVSIDTLRADHVGYHGYFRNTTPFIDSLAERGLAYLRAISTVSHTLPSHASMLTGLLPAEHGALTNAMELDPSVPNLTCMFSRNGWDTAAISSVRFLGGLDVGFGTFDVPEDLTDGHVNRPAGSTVDAALDWFQGRSTDEFFMWVHLFDVHEWGSGLDENRHGSHAASIRAGLDLETTFAETARLHDLPQPDDERFAAMRWRGERDSPYESGTREAVVYWIDSYDARLRYVDSQVERLFETIENAGLPGATLWVVVADHGEGLHQHGYKGHGKYIYQEQIHVPLVIYSSKPGFPDEEVNGLVSTADLAWTLREGWRQPGIPPDGRAPLPGLFQAASPDPERVVFSERRPADGNRVSKGGWSDERVVSIQTLQLKYIAHGKSADEAFSLGDDTGERENLLLLPEADRVFAPLLSRIVRQYGDLGREVEIVERPSAEVLEELKALGYVQ